MFALQVVLVQHFSSYFSCSSSSLPMDRNENVGFIPPKVYVMHQTLRMTKSPKARG